jgi:ketosteroid isomerase-like protein
MADNTVTRSEYKKIDWRDAVKSAATATYTGAFMSLASLFAGGVPTAEKVAVVATTVISTFFANLARSFHTNSSGEYLKSEPVKDSEGE